MMSSDKFTGYLVSIESKNLFYQGVINLIDVQNATIQLKNCFQNGINLGTRLIEIKTTEIDNIEILADPLKAATLLKPVTLIEKQDEHNQPAVNQIKAKPKNISPPTNSYAKRNYQNYQNGNNFNSEDCFNSPNEDDSIEEEFDFEKNLALFDKNAFYEKMEGHPRQSKNLAFNESTASVKKLEEPGTRYHQISVDNLFSSVTKQPKPVENRPSIHSNSSVNGLSGSKNYRFDEMILDTGEPINYRQIQVPTNCTKTYITDDGFIIPCIDLALRETLVNQSYKFGFNKQRQIECMGRCCAEMCLQLLGGSIRFMPKNNHQKPSILVLANNNSMQGVYAVCASRLLSIRTVKIYLLVLKSNEEESAEFKNELNFFKSNFDASCVLLNSVSDLSSIKSIDLILSGLDSFESSASLVNKIKNQTTLQHLRTYVQNCKASVLSIDPSNSSDTCVLLSKWCITPILPMVMPQTSGRVYLCDFGFTKQIFESVNIKYQSPFGAKFVIPLHDD